MSMQETNSTIATVQTPRTRKAPAGQQNQHQPNKNNTTTFFTKYNNDKNIEATTRSAESPSLSPTSAIDMSGEIRRKNPYQGSSSRTNTSAPRTSSSSSSSTAPPPPSTPSSSVTAAILNYEKKFAKGGEVGGGGGGKVQRAHQTQNPRLQAVQVALKADRKNNDDNTNSSDDDDDDLLAKKQNSSFNQPGMVVERIPRNSKLYAAASSKPKEAGELSRRTAAATAAAASPARTSNTSNNNSSRTAANTLSSARSSIGKDSSLKKIKQQEANRLAAVQYVLDADSKKNINDGDNDSHNNDHGGEKGGTIGGSNRNINRHDESTTKGKEKNSLLSNPTGNSSSVVVERVQRDNNSPDPAFVAADGTSSRITQKLNSILNNNAAPGTTNSSSDAAAPTASNNSMRQQGSNRNVSRRSSRIDTLNKFETGGSRGIRAGDGENGDDPVIAAPELQRANARSLPPEPGALRVRPGNAASNNISERFDDDFDETGTNDAAAVADEENQNQQREYPQKEISAKLVDDETDRERWRETLQDVLKNQPAAQAVDLEAEDRLKRARQRRNLRIYLTVAVIMTAVIIISVVITVKNTVTTEAPTEVPSMSPTMAPTMKRSAVETAVIEGFGELPAYDPNSPSSPQTKAIDWLTNEDTTIKFPIEDEDQQELFNDRYAAVVFAFSTGYENWIDNTGWLDPDQSVCDGWKGLTCNDDHLVSVLDLAIQNLTGTIPTEIGTMDHLDFLFLFGNSLTGTIPSELGKLDDVDFFYLNDNQLTGSLPPELSGLLDVDELYLFGNLLNGTIPDSFGDMVDLDRLYLNENLLSGTIPSSFSNLKQIKRLYLNNNNLSGNIPSELGEIISLERLLLDDNSFSGEIPPELGSFLGMNVLTLHGNELTGSMPFEICALRNREISIDSLVVLEADCASTNNTAIIMMPKVNCTCCTECY